MGFAHCWDAGRDNVNGDWNGTLLTYLYVVDHRQHPISPWSPAHYRSLARATSHGLSRGNMMPLRGHLPWLIEPIEADTGDTPSPNPNK